MCKLKKRPIGVIIRHGSLIANDSYQRIMLFCNGRDILIGCNLQHLICKWWDLMFKFNLCQKMEPFKEIHKNR